MKKALEITMGTLALLSLIVSAVYVKSNLELSHVFLICFVILRTLKDFKIAINTWKSNK